MCTVYDAGMKMQQLRTKHSREGRVYSVVFIAFDVTFVDCSSRKRKTFPLSCSIREQWISYKILELRSASVCLLRLRQSADG